VTIEPIQATQTTQTEINGQVNGSYDLTAGDYGTYIDNELAGTAKLRIVARLPSSAERARAARQGRVTYRTISQLKNKIISVNAPDDIGTLLVDSLLVEHGISPGQAWAAKYPNTLEAFTRALAQGSRSPTRTVRRWSSPSRSTWRSRPRPPRSSPCRASRPAWTRYASSGW
jgi:hypothetical protein